MSASPSSSAVRAPSDDAASDESANSGSQRDSLQTEPKSLSGQINDPSASTDPPQFSPLSDDGNADPLSNPLPSAAADLLPVGSVGSVSSTDTDGFVVVRNIGEQIHELNLINGAEVPSSGNTGGTSPEPGEICDSRSDSFTTANQSGSPLLQLANPTAESRPLSNSTGSASPNRLHIAETPPSEPVCEPNATAHHPSVSTPQNVPHISPALPTTSSSEQPSQPMNAPPATPTSTPGQKPAAADDDPYADVAKDPLLSGQRPSAEVLQLMNEQATAERRAREMEEASRLRFQQQTEQLNSSLLNGQTNPPTAQPSVSTAVVAAAVVPPVASVTVTVAPPLAAASAAVAVSQQIPSLPLSAQTADAMTQQLLQQIQSQFGPATAAALAAVSDSKMSVSAMLSLVGNPAAQQTAQIPANTVTAAAQPSTSAIGANAPTLAIPPSIAATIPPVGVVPQPAMAALAATPSAQTANGALSAAARMAAAAIGVNDPLTTAANAAAAAAMTTTEDRRKRREIYKWTGNMPLFAMGWSYKKYPDDRLRLVCSSVLDGHEILKNKMSIVEFNESDGELVEKAQVYIGTPSAELRFVPTTDPSLPELIASATRELRIYSYNPETRNVVLEAKMAPNKSYNYAGPLTSVDWNEVDPRIVGGCSTDSTCTVWDVEAQEAIATVPSTSYGGGVVAKRFKYELRTQLIAHEKPVHDMAFSRLGTGREYFASCGADGSVRMFDLRNLKHSTILYEHPTKEKLNHITWNKFEPSLFATVADNSNELVICDVRMPCRPIHKFSRHRKPVNSVDWAPHSPHHLCSGSSDQQALIWQLPASQEPMLAYGASGEITRIRWSSTYHNWIGIAYGESLEILRV